MKKYIGIIGVIALVAVIFLASDYLKKAEDVRASAPMGMEANRASSSQITLGAYETLQIIGTSTCVSRIVTPAPTQIRFLLEDSVARPSAGVGHLMAASSTTAYDSALYGCGLWRAFNNSASTSIFTLTEFTGFR